MRERANEDRLEYETVAVRRNQARADMGISEIETVSRTALRAEALGWLRRLNSGEATTADVEALDRWRACSPAHAAEFAEAALFWNVLGDAARKAECRRIVPASTRGVAR